MMFSNELAHAPSLVAFYGEAHEITKRQVREWFGYMDRLLDIHRNNYVFRDVALTELAQHKEVFRLAIRCCNQIQAIIGDPDFNEPDLVSQLKVRVQQLQDAYDTFHDPDVSDEKAERVLADVFPQ